MDVKQRLIHSRYMHKNTVLTPFFTSHFPSSSKSRYHWCLKLIKTVEYRRAARGLEESRTTKEEIQLAMLGNAYCTTSFEWEILICCATVNCLTSSGVFSLKFLRDLQFIYLTIGCSGHLRYGVNCLFSRQQRVTICLV